MPAPNLDGDILGCKPIGRRAHLTVERFANNAPTFAIGQMPTERRPAIAHAAILGPPGAHDPLATINNVSTWKRGVYRRFTDAAHV
jgi:hypothetical protein